MPCGFWDDGLAEDGELQGAEALSRGGYAGFALPSARPKYGRDLGWEPMDMNIALVVDMDSRTLRGTVRIECVARRSGVTSLALDAIDFKEISVLGPDQTGEYDGKKFTVYWPNPSVQGETRFFTVRFLVVDPITGFSFVQPDQQYPGLPTMASTDHETERARYWLPCVDHPSVRTTLHFVISAPEGLTTLANGELLGTTSDPDIPGFSQTSWKLDFPCPSYLICIAIGDFVRADGGTHQGKRVEFYAPKNLYCEQDLLNSFGATKELLAWMTTKLNTPLPWPKYYQFAFSGGVGGAMENISLVSWTDAYVHDSIMDEERGWLVETVNCHEMAHTYFGNSLVIADFLHAWLKESWANYMELVWLQDKYGEEALQYQLILEREYYTTEADENYVRPIVTRRHDCSWSMFDSHLYPGGALRIHMLRTILGDAVFWPAVTDYIHTHFKQTVETSDFRRVLEKHSGRNLELFFDQWIHSCGYPKLKGSLSFNSDRKEIIITVEQNQIDASRGIGLFDIELEVEILAAIEGAQTTTHVLTLSSEVNGGKGMLVLAGFDKKPAQVVFDPNGKVLHKMDFMPGAEMLGRILQSHRCVYTRCNTAVALSNLASPAASDILIQAFSQEKFWGVRRSIASALGTIASMKAHRSLLGFLKTEPDKRVVSVIVTALGHVRSTYVADALVGILESAEKSPMTLGHIATSQALSVIGRNRQEGAKYVPFLASFLDQPEKNQWWAWVRRAAAVALGSTRTEEAAEVLLSKLPYGEVRGVRGLAAVRSSVAQSLAQCLEWSPAHRRAMAAERLADQLHVERQYSVRVGCARALSKLGDAPASIPALRGFLGQCVNQDVPKVERMIDEGGRVRKTESWSGTVQLELEAAKDELKGCKDSIKELQARLDALHSTKLDMSS